MEKLDRKFFIVAKKTKDGTTVTEHESVLFLAKDNAFLPTLHFYLEECKRQGTGESQLLGISLLIERVRRWRDKNPDKLKLPDITGSFETDDVCKPNDILAKP